MVEAFETYLAQEATMAGDDFLVHSAEQVLRFTRVAAWDDLSEERKVQLGFNLGALVKGLGLSKADGYDVMTQARLGQLPMAQMRAHFADIIARRGLAVQEEKILRDF
jgi:hypothetical protein